MNSQANAEIRYLTSTEIEHASGALTLSAGPLRLKVGEDGLYVSLQIDGVGSVNVDGGGVWGDWKGKGYGLGA
jgi:hypothetical protein